MVYLGTFSCDSSSKQSQGASVCHHQEIRTQSTKGFGTLHGGGKWGKEKVMLRITTQGYCALTNELGLLQLLTDISAHKYNITYQTKIIHTATKTLINLEEKLSDAQTAISQIKQVWKLSIFANTKIVKLNVTFNQQILYHINHLT